MEKQIEFLPIDYSDFDFKGESWIKIYGRSKEGKRACVIDKFLANFWVLLEDNINEGKIEEIRKKIGKIEIENNVRNSSVIKTEVHDKKYLGKDKKAIRVFITNQKDAMDFCDNIRKIQGVDKTREADISLATKYIMDSGLKPLRWHVVNGEILNNSEELGKIDSTLEVDLILKLKKSEEIKEEKSFSPKILAFDIEASEFELGKGEILMISLHGENYSRVFTWKHCSKKQDYVTCFKSEEDMLENFIEEVKKQSPDLLVGYFSDGFDLPYIKARCQMHKLPFDIGLDGSQVNFRRGRIPQGKIEGITHVDLFRFVKTIYSQYLQSETLSLNEVAGELVGEKKEEFDFSKINKMKEEDWRDFFSYNLKDSVLTYKLAEKLWPDMIEFSRIIQEPLFDITRDGMSQLLENYILHNLSYYNEIAEKRPHYDEIGERRGMKKVEGAFVFQPKPGLYENLAIFDFTSMHTSIIVSFNIGKDTLLEKKEKDSFESPEVELDGKEKKFYFSKKIGFLSDMCKKLIEKRKEYKKDYQKNPNPLTKAKSNAFKLLSAAVHGYIGFFGARYYSHECSASILGFVRKFNKETIDKVNEGGFEVIYGDTDSVAFLLKGKKKEDVQKFLEKLNKELPGIMEMELEDFYKRGLFVAKKTKAKDEEEAGAKKKYALVDSKGKMKIRGFETVRRDWCQLARNLQNKVLEAILTDGDEKRARKIFEEVVEKLKTRKVKKEEILIRTQLKKSLNEYLAITPHVIAAQKMQAAGMPVDVGMLLEFFIAETREKKALVRDKVKLPDEKGEYNIEYYLNNQILPAVENIFDVFNINVQDISDGSSQKKLF